MTCGKTIYPDKRAAETARNSRLHSRHNRPCYLRIYPCPDCQGWHLAHGKDPNSKFAKPIHGPRYHRPSPARLIPPASDV